MLDIVNFDPEDIIDLKNKIPEFQNFIDNIGPGFPNKLLDSKTIKVGIKARGKLGKVLDAIQTLPRATERIGEFGASVVARMLGFKPLNLSYSNTGIDAVLYNESIDRYMILEAKGSNSSRRLSKLNKRTDPSQFSHPWIKNRLDTLIRRSLGSRDGQQLQDSVDNGKLAVATVVSLNLKASKLRIGAQIYDPNDSRSFLHWRGF